MIRKEYVKYDTIRNNSFKMARRILEDGFMPDVIYVSLRGGACLGNTISEYFKAVRKDERPVYYAAVVARSYVDVAQSGQVRVEGWTYPPEHLRLGDRVLLLDDIFDTGHTINCLAGIILERGIPRKDLKIAVHDYKFFHDKTEQLPVQPDYWCRRFDLSVKDPPFWIHYLSHELTGLDKDALEENYYSQDGSLRGVLGFLE